MRHIFKHICNGPYDNLMVDLSVNSPARLRKNIYECANAPILREVGWIANLSRILGCMLWHEVVGTELVHGCGCVLATSPGLREQGMTAPFTHAYTSSFLKQRTCMLQMVVVWGGKFGHERWEQGCGADKSQLIMHACFISHHKKT